MKRTVNNGELRRENIDQEVGLKGWASKVRNLGGIIFIDLRDRYGITQLAIYPNSAVYETAAKVKNEFVLEALGKVVLRQSINKNIPTGEIEVVVDELNIISTSKPLPMIIQDETDALEDTRLKYRYLDLRRPTMQKNFILRHNVVKSIREYLNNNEFIEFETPILSKSTPEGARDYLVPSRIYPGQFYALPQSPQLFKQLLMVAGFERYYQIAKCFRDEDLRADRQPEFTQVDIETSFLDQEELLTLMEGLLKKLMKDIKNIDVETPFSRMTYNYAMENYGSDKPDTRFDLRLYDLTDILASSSLDMFKLAKENKQIIKAINLKNLGAKYSRKEIDKLTDFVKKYKAKGLAWIKLVNNELSGSIAKHLTNEELEAIKEKMNFEENDTIFIVVDKKSVVLQTLGALRNKLAYENNMADENVYDFKWVVDWPLFEYDEETNTYSATHHPFTACKKEQIPYLFTDPSKCYSDAYDIVLHGYEIGGGSIRIHQEDIQNQIFNILNITPEQQETKFGFFLEALKYGTPPHGGIALGLDRICMILLGTTNIKDVILFPKTTSAQCLMSNCPSEVDPGQLKDLGIKVE